MAHVDLPPGQPLQILMLGPAEVRWKGNLYPIARRTPRTLLYYLASRGTLAGRDELLALLWGELPESTARLRLRETLNKLRSSLPELDLLLTQGNLVGLDLSRTHVDVLVFQRYMEEVGYLPWASSNEQPLPAALYLAMLEALSLWRGTSFLSGTDLTHTAEFDEWLTISSQHLSQQRDQIRERLIVHEIQIGNLEAALSLAQAGLQWNASDERLNMHILRLLLQLGKKEAARQHYQSMVAMLGQVPETYPFPEIGELFSEEVRKHSFELNSAPDWKIQPSIKVPFVGRMQYLAQLRKCFYSGGGVFIQGEAGQGKTRLLQEFSALLQAPVRVLLAQCRPLQSNLPFQPIVDVLRNQVQPAEWLQLSESWASQLSVLFPEVISMRPGIQAPVRVSPEQSRALVLEALRQIMVVIARNSRLLLILDDAHWADEATLATIAYLVNRSPFDRQALLIIVSRPEERSPELEQSIRSFRASPRFIEIQLERLDEHEVSDLAWFVLGVMPPPEFTGRLKRETGGNPLFILETLRAMLEQQIFPDPSKLDAEITIPLTERIHKLVSGRLQTLSPIARVVLEAGAILGFEFRTRWIERMELSSLDEHLIGESYSLEEKIVQGIEELEHRFLIEKLTGEGGYIRYRFMHDKIREIVIAEISPARRQLLHRRAAQALEMYPGVPSARGTITGWDTPAGELAAVLAKHYEDGDEPLQAYRYWILAGERAVQLFSSIDASRAFLRAEENLVRCKLSCSNEDIYRLYRSWGEMAFALNDAQVLQSLGTRLLSIGKERQSPLLIGTGYVRLANACFCNAQNADGLDWVNRAIESLEIAGHLYQLAEARILRGAILYMEGKNRDAIRNYEQLLTELHTIDDLALSRPRANAHYELGIASTLGGWPAVGCEHALHCSENYLLIQDTQGVIIAYNLLALANYLLDNYSQTRQILQQGIELAERADSHRMLGYLHCTAGLLDLAQGNISGLIVHANQVTEIGRSLGRADLQGFGMRMLGDGYFRLCDYQVAAEHYQQAIQIDHDSVFFWDCKWRLGLTQVLGSRSTIAPAALLAAMPAAWPDEITDSFALINDTINQTQEAGLATGWLGAKLGLARSCLQLGDFNQADDILHVVCDEAEQRGFRSLRLEAILFQAEVARQKGRWVEAVQLLETTRAIAADVGCFWPGLMANQMILQMDMAQLDSALGAAYVESAVRGLLDKLMRLEFNLPDDPMRNSYDCWKAEIVRHLNENFSEIVRNISN
jgi:DNA-binding SARP family transcriptional activator